jgi:hypothetical protein
MLFFWDVIFIANFSLYVYVWLPWLRFFRAFFSVVRQMPGVAFICVFSLCSYDVCVIGLVAVVPAHKQSETELN